MSDKKWYNYFVVRTPAEEAAARAAEPARVADIAAGTSEVTFSDTGLTPEGMTEIYSSAQIAVPAHGYSVLKVAAMLQSEHIRALQYNLNQSKYAVAVPAGNFDLIYEVNAAIDKFRGPPQYAELMREYLSSSSEVFMQPIAGRRTYTVRAGDTLTKIAQAQLKDMNRWKEIWDLNRDRVANENLIYTRLVLLMP